MRLEDVSFCFDKSSDVDSLNVLISVSAFFCLRWQFYFNFSRILRSFSTNTRVKEAVKDNSSLPAGLEVVGSFGVFRREKLKRIRHHDRDN